MQKPILLYLGNVLSGHGFTPTTIETLSKKLGEDFEMVVASTKKNKVARMLDLWRHIWKYRGKANYVLIDTYSSSAFNFAWTSGAFAHAMKVKYIPFLHGGNLPERFAKSHKTSKTYLSRASVIVSPSGFLQDAVRKQFGLEALVIPNYLELENYPFLQRGEMVEARLLWVRSFHETYNPTMAIKLVKWLNDKGLQTTLTMVGPTKDETQNACVALAASLGITDKIVFTGKRTKPEWIGLSATHNVFINTTNIDNTPVSVMEAMALGMPVVTTNVGGIPFLFADGKEGLMTPVADVAAMGAVILALHKNPKRTAEISLAARKKAESWDWQVVKKQWVKLLTS